MLSRVSGKWPGAFIDQGCPLEPCVRSGNAARVIPSKPHLAGLAQCWSVTWRPSTANIDSPYTALLMRSEEMTVFGLVAAGYYK